jgi:hypothetical protein
MLEPIPQPSFQGLVSTPYLVDNGTYKKTPVYTDLAISIMHSQPATALSEVFPDETIMERTIVAEYEMTGIDTIFPVVSPGKPDIFVNDDGPKRYRMVSQPIFIRQSMGFSYADLNNAVAPGTTNTRDNAAAIIAREMERQVRKHTLTWDIFRAKMLLGGINFTERRTGVSVNAASNIPARNLFRFDLTQGYGGRNETRLFRNYIDSNAAGNPASGVPCTDPDYDWVYFFGRINWWNRSTNKTPITDCYISPEMHEVMMLSNQARLYKGGIVPRVGAQFGDASIDTNGTGGSIGPHPASAYGDPTGFVFNADGSIYSIRGIVVHTITTEFKDPQDGIEKRVWPKHKIVFVSFQNFDGQREAPGRTQYCASENSVDTPGFWTREYDNPPPPAAPGKYIQMGNAGLPYLKFPFRVLHVIPCTVQNVIDRLGIQGELFFSGL